MTENKNTTAAFDDPRWILIRASKIGLALTLVAGVSAAGVIIVLALTWWLTLLLMIALSALLALEISRLALLRPDSIIAFYLVTLDPVDSDNLNKAARKNNLGIRLRHRNGRDSEGRVRDGAFVMPWFMNIPYIDEKPTSRSRKLFPRLLPRLLPRLSPRVLPLWRDAVTPDDARRTRVKLRWQ